MLNLFSLLWKLSLSPFTLSLSLFMPNLSLFMPNPFTVNSHNRALCKVFVLVLLLVLMLKWLISLVMLRLLRLSRLLWLFACALLSLLWYSFGTPLLVSMSARSGMKAALDAYCFDLGFIISTIVLVGLNWFVLWCLLSTISSSLLVVKELFLMVLLFLVPTIFQLSCPVLLVVSFLYYVFDLYYY